MTGATQSSSIAVRDGHDCVVSSVESGTGDAGADRRTHGHGGRVAVVAERARSQGSPSVRCDRFGLPINMVPPFVVAKFVAPKLSEHGCNEVVQLLGSCAESCFIHKEEALLRLALSQRRCEAQTSSLDRHQSNAPASAAQPTGRPRSTRQSLTACMIPMS